MAMAILPLFLARPPLPPPVLPIAIDSQHTFAFLLLHLTIAAIFLASTKLCTSSRSSAPKPAQYHSTSTLLCLPAAAAAAASAASTGAAAAADLQQHPSSLPTLHDASAQNPSSEIAHLHSSSSCIAPRDSCREFIEFRRLDSGRSTARESNTSSEIAVSDTEHDCCPPSSFHGSTVDKELDSVDSAPFPHEIDRRAEEFIRRFYQRCTDAGGDK